MDQFLDLFEFLASLRFCPANHRENAGHDLQIIRRAAETGQPAFDIAIEGAGILDILVRGKDDFRGAGGQILARLR